LNLPEEIENTFLELAAFDERIKQRRSRVRSLELQITLDACSAKDESGKPVLKNEREREAAIATMLSESEEFAELATELGNLEQDRLRLQARLERLRMEFKVEMLEAEQRNHLAALKVADSIWAARNYQLPRAEPDIVLPF
jgi:molecular chaperone GrpE (heat shock protein)